MNGLEQVPPERADREVAAREQRMSALGDANRIRTARAMLKNDLATGRARVEDVLTHPPAFAATAKVSDLLLAVPGFGPVRATRALTRCQISHGKTAAGLSERQRVALVALLRSETPAEIDA